MVLIVCFYSGWFNKISFHCSFLYCWCCYFAQHLDRKWTGKCYWSQQSQWYPNLKIKLLRRHNNCNLFNATQMKQMFAWSPKANFMWWTRRYLKFLLPWHHISSWYYITLEKKLYLWHSCAAGSTLQTYKLSKCELIWFLCIESLLRILSFTIYNNTESVAYESFHMF